MKLVKISNEKIMEFGLMDSKETVKNNVPINDSMVKKLENIKTELITSKQSASSNVDKIGIIKRGDIFYVNKPTEEETHVTQGRRPFVIVSNDVGNKHSSLVIGAPLTSKYKKPMPTHVKINYSNNINSTILCENITTLDKSWLDSYVGHVNENDIEKINKAIKVSLALAEMDNVPQDVVNKWAEMYRIDYSGEKPVVEIGKQEKASEEIVSEEQTSAQDMTVKDREILILKTELEIYKKVYGDIIEVLKK